MIIHNVEQGSPEWLTRWLTNHRISRRIKSIQSIRKSEAFRVAFQLSSSAISNVQLEKCIYGDNIAYKVEDNVENQQR